MKSLFIAPVLAALLAGPAFADKFETIPHSAAVVLSENTTQADVDAQVRANNAAGRASYDAVAREGGCNADFIPPSIAAYCWSRLVGSGTPNTQGPIGASAGGSD